MSTRELYLDSCHAMQSGVAFLLSKNPNCPECQPKHLRVGINTAMSDHAALVHLLVKKGIISIEEYEQACLEFMRIEIKRYKKIIKDEYNLNVDLY